MRGVKRTAEGTYLWRVCDIECVLIQDVFYTERTAEGTYVWLH